MGEAFSSDRLDSLADKRDNFDPMEGVSSLSKGEDEAKTSPNLFNDTRFFFLR